MFVVWCCHLAEWRPTDEMHSPADTDSLVTSPQASVVTPDKFLHCLTNCHFCTVFDCGVQWCPGLCHDMMMLCQHSQGHHTSDVPLTIIYTTVLPWRRSDRYWLITTACSSHSSRCPRPAHTSQASTVTLTAHASTFSFRLFGAGKAMAATAWVLGSASRSDEGTELPSEGEG